MHYKVEKNATRKEFGRELSLEVFVVSNNNTRTVLGTDARTARCSIPLDSGKSWLNSALKLVIFSIFAQRNKRWRPGYRDCHIYLIVLLGLSTKLGI